MAASITGVFTVIDRASRTMKSMERQALKTMAAIEGVGKAQDKLAARQRKVTQGWEKERASVNKMGRELERTHRVMRDVEQATRRQGNETQKLGTHVRTTGNRFEELATKLGKFNAVFKFFGTLMSAGKILAMGAALAVAAQGIGTLAGGLTSLITVLARAGQAFAAFPGVVSAAVQGMGVFKLAMGGVAEALKAGITIQQQHTQVVQDAAEAHIQAVHGVQEAEYGLMVSQRNVKDAQIQLTQARRDAIRNLTDLRFAAEAADLAQQRASLNLREAQRAVVVGALNPQSTDLDIASQQLAVREAQLQVRQSRVERTRAHVDSRRAQARGVNRNLQVIAAQRAVADSMHAEKNAAFELASAQRALAREISRGTGPIADFRQAMKNLSAEARTFVKHVLALYPAFKRLREQAGAGLFPGLDRMLGNLQAGFPAAGRIARRTGGVIGNAAADAAARFMSPGRLKDLETLGNANVKILNRMLRGATNLAGALVDFMVAAKPFTDWLTHVVFQATEWVANWARAGRETGSFAKRLDRTEGTLKRLWSIAKNLFGVLRGIFRGASPLGDRLLRDLDKATGKWNAFFNSPGGVKQTRHWFDQLHAPLKEFFGLLGDVGKAWAQITVSGGLTEVLKVLRGAVPPLEALFVKLAQTAPDIAQLLSDIVRVLADIDPGPLRALVKFIDLLVKGIDWLLRKIPILSPMLATGVGLFLAGTALAGGIKLLDVVIKKWKKLYEWVRALFGLRGGPPSPPVPPGGPRTPGTGPEPVPTPGVPGGPEPVPVPGRPGRLGRLGRRLGRFGRAAGRFADPLIIVGSVGAAVAGNAIGGRGGRVLADAGTGAAIGGTVGSFVPVIGTGIGAAVGGALGAGVGLFTGGGHGGPSGQQAAAMIAQRGNPAEIRARIQTLQRHLDERLAPPPTTPGSSTGVLGAQAGVQATPGMHKLTGSARKRAQDQLNTLKPILKDMDNQLHHMRVKQSQSHARDLAQKMGGTFRVYEKRFGPSKAMKLAVGDMLTHMDKMKPQGRKILGDGVLSWAREMARKNPALKGQMDDLVRRMKSKFSELGEHIRIVNGRILDGSKTEWDNIGSALRDPIEKAKEKVAQGFTDMQRMAIGSLEAMGFSPSQARSLVRGLQAGGERGRVSHGIIQTNRAHPGAISVVPSAAAETALHATGGRITGTGYRDTVPLTLGMAAPGELIVNRHTERRVMAKYGVDLGREVASETKPHSAQPNYGIQPGFAQGGRVGNIQSMRAAARTIDAKHYPYLWGGGHNPQFAGPYDCSGAVSAVLHAGGLLNTPVTSGQLMSMFEPGPGGRRGVTIYANPGHTYMKIGNRFFGTSTANPRGGAGWFVGAARPGFVQRHLPLGGPQTPGQVTFAQQLAQAAGLGQVGAPQINLPGVPGALAQQAVNIAAAGINEILADASGGAGAPGGLTTAGGRYNKGQLERLWVRAGGPQGVANVAAAIALAESSGNPRITNPGGAAGLWQIFGLPFPGNPLNPLTNARMAVAKYHGAGNSFTPWTTFTGADTPGHEKTYLRYMAMGGRVPPNPTVPSYPTPLSSYYDSRHDTFHRRGEMFHQPRWQLVRHGQRLSKPNLGPRSYVDPWVHVPHRPTFNALGGRLLEWGGWHAQGGSFNVSRPTLFGAGEAGPEKVTISRNTAGGGRDITVHIAKVEMHRPGDLRKAIHEELVGLAEDIDAATGVE